jgi:hypothetical protein
MCVCCVENARNAQVFNAKMVAIERKSTAMPTSSAGADTYNTQVV